MSSADKRIAELEAKVETLETQMRHMAEVVGSLMEEVCGERQWPGIIGNPLVWTVQDPEDGFSMWEYEGAEPLAEVGSGDA